ncbi:MAG: hypothetical protein WCF54_08230 [Terracidiphilus sp.]
MKIGSWAGWAELIAVGALLSGCGDFWQAPNNGATSFTLGNSGNIAVTQGSTNTDTITVTPGSSFTGTVALTCSVTSGPSTATSSTDPTCSFSESSLTFSSTSSQDSTLTVAASSSTPVGAYQMKVTGTSGSVAAYTTFCVAVGSTTSSCSSTAASGIFYVLNQTTNQVVALSLASGNLTTIGTYTTPTPTPLAIAVAPNKNFLYVSTNSGIYLYSITSSGALTLGNSSTRVSSDPANSMQVDATDSWLVYTINGIAQLNAVNINSSTGLPLSSTGSVPSTGLPAATPLQLAISPNDSSSCTDCFVFVAMGDGGTELIPFNPAPSGGNPFGTAQHQPLASTGVAANTVAVDPSNRLLYVGETNDFSTGTQTGGLRAFTISSVGTTEVSGSPYVSGGTGPTSILPSADGNYVYVANSAVSGSSTDNINSFSVVTSGSTATGLKAVGTAAAGPTGAIGLAEDSTGTYLLAIDFAGGPDLQAFTMSSGTLSSVFTGETGTDPVGAVAIGALP